MPEQLLRPTPSQTIGPFFHFALPWPGAAEIVDPGRADALRIEGRVFDGADAPVGDALVEVWQADADGHYAHPEDPAPSSFRGYGRSATDAEGRYRFRTVKPGRVPAPGGGSQAPHLNVSVFSRGLLARLSTRLYFPDEGEANAADPVLGRIEDLARRQTLVAVAAGGILTFDIHLQGERETVFFAV